MEAFRDSLLRSSADLIEKARKHPFVTQTAAGTIPDERFRRWVAQDYLWIREFERFLAMLAARAPREIRRPFFEDVLNIHGEIELLEEMSARMGIDLLQARMTFICHAYTEFLLATGALRSFELCLAVCYAAAFIYLDGWSYAKKTQAKSGKWHEFIDFWSGEGFRHWVDAIARAVDAVAEKSTPAVLEQMKEMFQVTVRYELRFWDMAFEDTDW